VQPATGPIGPSRFCFGEEENWKGSSYEEGAMSGKDKSYCELGRILDDEARDRDVRGRTSPIRSRVSPATRRAGTWYRSTYMGGPPQNASS
jgi:hypothetical protein